MESWKAISTVMMRVINSVESAFHDSIGAADYYTPLFSWLAASNTHFSLRQEQKTQQTYKEALVFQKQNKLQEAEKLLRDLLQSEVLAKVRFFLSP